LLHIAVLYYADCNGWWRVAHQIKLTVKRSLQMIRKELVGKRSVLDNSQTIIATSTPAVMRRPKNAPNTFQYCWSPNGCVVVLEASPADATDGDATDGDATDTTDAASFLPLRRAAEAASTHTTAPSVAASFFSVSLSQRASPALVVVVVYSTLSLRVFRRSTVQ